MPINPVHGIVLTTGNVLYIAGSGNCPPGQTGCPTGFGSATVWNPKTGAFNTLPISLYDMFCNGATQMADGKIFINSGTQTYATSLIRALAAAEDDNEYLIYVNRETADLEITDAPNFRVVRCGVRATSRPAR